MGHRLHQAPFTLSADCALCLQSAGAPAMVIDEGWGAGVCMCVWVRNYVCMKMSVGKHLSVWLFVSLISSLYLCVSVWVCVCAVRPNLTGCRFHCHLSHFFSFKWPSESCGCSSYPELVASLSQSLPRMGGGGNKAFLIGNGTSRQIKWLGVWNADPHGNSILCV